MSDVAAPTPPSFNNSSKAAITLIVLLFNAAIIVYTVAKGDGGNTLHSSAQAWAYMVNGGVLLGLGIGSFAPDIVNAFTKR